MTEEKDIHFKQTKLFNPKTEQKKIHIYGAGSIGSHVAMGLAKTGYNDLTIYDYDVVEESNVPAQFFNLSNVGASKLDAITENIKSYTGTTINTISGKITESFTPNLTQDSIHIICFDNIEGRKLIYEKLKDFPVMMIDGRIGAFNYQIYTNDMIKDSTLYAKSLEGVFSELQCGEKCLWGVNSLISSKIVAQVLRITKGKPVYSTIKGNLLSETVICKVME